MLFRSINNLGAAALKYPESFGEIKVIFNSIGDDLSKVFKAKIPAYEPPIMTTCLLFSLDILLLIVTCFSSILKWVTIPSQYSLVFILL